MHVKKGEKTKTLVIDSTSAKPETVQVISQKGARTLPNKSRDDSHKIRMKRLEETRTVIHAFDGQENTQPEVISKSKLAQSLVEITGGTSMTDGLIELATEDQLNYLTDIGVDVVKEVVKNFGLTLSKDGAKRICSRNNELKSAITSAVLKSPSDLSISKYRGQLVHSGFGYFSGYEAKEVKSVAKQMKISRKFFPKIGNAYEGVNKIALPEFAEGWFVRPRYQDIAPTYGEAVEKLVLVLEAENDCKFKNWKAGKLSSKYLRESSRTSAFFEKISKEQSKFETIVFAAQFGVMHRGKSAGYVLENLLDNEFGLDIFTVLTMLITHPERLMHENDLSIDCLGSEYFDDATGDFSRVVYLQRDRRGFNLGAFVLLNPNVSFGSATAIYHK